MSSYDTIIAHIPMFTYISQMMYLNSVTILIMFVHCIVIYVFILSLICNSIGQLFLYKLYRMISITWKIFIQILLSKSPLLQILSKDNFPIFVVEINESVFKSKMHSNDICYPSEDG